MARVTVEDCITKISNRFKLVMLAAQRARQISAGSELLVERDRDKNPVVALREIAEDKVLPDALLDGVITGFQKHAHRDEPEEEVELESQEPINPEEAKAQLAATKPPSPKDKDPLEY